MPLFTRRRLDCFYCGNKSIQRYEYGLPKWKCENCQADNYLDANGEITEPPAPSTPTVSKAPRYAQTIPRARSPGPTTTDSNPFCQTCLNNQHLVTQNLANYLPDTSDPRYPEFERNLPKYKKELEQRYPQVCQKCEPRVRARMRAAGDLAKADYLGRMMQKTKQIGLPKDVWTPIFLLSTVGALLWWFSTIVFILWNAFGALASITDQEELLPDPNDVNIIQCIAQAAAFARVEPTCASTVYSLSGCGVIAGLASFWWNPIMRRRNIDRTTGLDEFYKLQALLLTFRCGVWFMLGKGWTDLEPEVLRLVHAIMLGMNLVVPIMAYKAPRIAKNPKIAFHNKEDLSYSPSQASPQQAEQSHHRLQPTPHTTTTSASVSFPFSRLGEREQHTPARVPTPPVEEDSDVGDAMDIDSPQPKHNFRPVTKSTPIQSSGPSPFYGKLPLAPVSQEHRLRNPPNKPTFQKTSEQRQEKFFQSMARKPNELDEDPDSPREMHLEPPKFFPAQDHQETGLEGWFSSNVFSLGEPSSVSSITRDTVSQSAPIAPNASSRGYSIPLVSILLLLSALGIWQLASKLSPSSTVAYFASAGLVALVTIIRLVTVLSAPTVNGSDILLYIIGLPAAAILIHNLWRMGLSDDDSYNFLEPYSLKYFGWMILQECLIMFTIWWGNRGRPQMNTRATIEPDQDNGRSPREKKPLPLDNGSILYKAQQRAAPAPAPAPVQASGGLSGLSLGLSSGGNSPTNPMQRTSRVLRGRVRNPWEVGGL